MERRRTVYHRHDYRMRSYTEFRWAKLLEAADIFYLYEPHLHQIEGGKYLPDFFLPHVGIYLEVKGDYPTDEEKRKADQVIERTGCEVVFLVGLPQSDQHGLHGCLTFARGRYGWVDVSGHELDQMMLKILGYGPWARLIVAARDDDMDYVRRIGEVVEEMVIQALNRSALESHLRMTHRRTNDARMAAIPDPSLVEQGLKWWFVRQAGKLAAWKAQEQTEAKEAAHA